MMQLSDMVIKANCEMTWVHIANKENWFQIWSSKAEVAHTIIVMFDEFYKV